MVKGVNFLLGAELLPVAGFVPSGLAIAAALAAILASTLLRMPQGRKGSKFAEVVSRDRNINWPSAARDV